MMAKEKFSMKGKKGKKHLTPQQKQDWMSHKNQRNQQWKAEKMDQAQALWKANDDCLIHLVEKFSKHPFLLDPDKAAEAAKLKSLTGTLLKKYGPHSGAGVVSDTLIPKAAGRSSGPPLSSLRRKPVTQELKNQIKGGAAMRRSHSGC